MKWSLEFIVILFSLLATAGSQACDTSSNIAQCSEGERCVGDVCEDATHCNSSRECSGTTDTVCVADYCQPPECTATGQCVNGQICSHDRPRSCVYPINLKAEENTELMLNFSGPGTGGTYEEIEWFKGNKGSDYRIVYVHPVLTEGEPLYYGDYCSGSDSCDTSDKGELNPDTGTFTINWVNMTDGDYYYYKFHGYNAIPDTGGKYEIKLEVYVTPKEDEMSIKGITDNIEEVGTLLDLTCTINRIKPEAAEMYWTIKGERENGSLTNVTNVDGTFNQTNALEYTVAKEDEDKLIKCVVVPVYGTVVEVEQIVNPGYAPSGKPNLQPPSTEKHADEDVVLTCNKPDDDGVGNPPCDTYTWKQVEGIGGTSQTTNTWKFPMDESSAGNYTCTCENDYGASRVSNKAEVIFLVPAPAPASGTSVDIGLIAGLVGGIAVFIGLLIGAVVFIRRYNIDIRLSKKKRSPSVPTDSGLKEGYEDLRANPAGHEYDTLKVDQDKDDYMEAVVHKPNIPQVYHEVKWPSQKGQKPDAQQPAHIYDEVLDKQGRTMKNEGGYVNQAAANREYENTMQIGGQSQPATYVDLL